MGTADFANDLYLNFDDALYGMVKLSVDNAFDQDDAQKLRIHTDGYRIFMNS